MESKRFFALFAAQLVDRYRPNLPTVAFKKSTDQILAGILGGIKRQKDTPSFSKVTIFK